MKRKHEVDASWPGAQKRPKTSGFDTNFEENAEKESFFSYYFSYVQESLKHIFGHFFSNSDESLELSDDESLESLDPDLYLFDENGEELEKVDPLENEIDYSVLKALFTDIQNGQEIEDERLLFCKKDILAFRKMYNKFADEIEKMEEFNEEKSDEFEEINPSEMKPCFS